MTNENKTIEEKQKLYCEKLDEMFRMVTDQLSESPLHKYWVEKIKTAKENPPTDEGVLDLLIDEDNMFPKVQFVTKDDKEEEEVVYN